MRSSSSSSFKRRMRSMGKERENRKSSKWLKRFSKELIVCIEKGIIFSTKVCYRNMHDHPFLAGFVLFGFLLYAFLPSLFWFLVSSSPVIICTALLLGTLLSFGEPHIPEVEEEKKKTVREISPLQDRTVNDDVVINKKKMDFLDQSTSESESEIEDGAIPSPLEVGEPSKKVGFREYEGSSPKSSLGLDREIESRGREFGEARDLVGDLLARVHSLKTSRQTESTLVSTSSLVDGVVEPREEFFENTYDHGYMVAGDTTHVSRNSTRILENVHDIDAIGEVELEGFKPELDMGYYTLLKPSEDRDDHSDFGSDKSESCSPDASISDINPMLDELCPFIPSNNVEDSDLSIFSPTIHANMDDLVSGSERSTQSPSSVYGSDELAINMEEEEEEEEEEALEDKDGMHVAWTVDDEKNVMDLGSSEVERNRRLENLMAKRRERKNTNPAELGIFLGLRNEDTSPLGDRLTQLRVQVSSISTNRKNPFDDESEDIGGLPPIPGSAPSILLRKSNPFDFPEKSFTESGNAIGADQSELYFKGFTTGSASASSNKEDEHNDNEGHYLVPEEKVYRKYQRQLSELSYPKMRSMFKSEHLYPVPDQEYGRDPLVLNTHEGDESDSLVKHDGEFAIEDENDHSWNKGTDETEALIFDLTGTSEVHDTSRARAELEVESTDAIQYGSFSSFETKVDEDGNVVERVFHFDSDEKLDSPRIHSDETVVSDSSTESEKSSGSEHSGDEMIPASHPSVDEPVVLPSEVSILPAIADQIKASFRQEEINGSSQSDVLMQDATDNNSDGNIVVADKSQAEQEGDFVERSENIMGKTQVIYLAKDLDWLDEGILSELDVVGDFGVGKSQKGHDQALKDIQSYDEAEIQASGNADTMESNTREADHIEKTLEHLEFAMKKHAEASSAIATTSGLKDSDSGLPEIEARCYDDIDLALMHHAGISLDDVLVEDEHLELSAHQSNIPEIKARSLDDIDLALMSHAGFQLNDDLVEDPHLKASPHQSDLPEIKARSLEDLREAFGGRDKLLSEDDKDSDLQEIEVQSLAELHKALRTEDAPKESALISLEQHEVEDDVIEDMHLTSEQKGVVPKLEEIRACSLKDLHAAIFNTDVTSEPVELPHDVHEVASDSSEGEILESVEDGGHLGSEMVSIESLEPGKEVGSTGQEDRQSEKNVSNLHEIEAQTLEELRTIFAKQDKQQDPAVPRSDVHETDDQSDIVYEPQNTHPETDASHLELHQTGVQIPKDVHMVETHSCSVETEAHLEGGTSLSLIEQDGDTNIEKIHTNMHEAELQTLKIFHIGQEDSTAVLSGVPEAKAQPVEDKDTISGHEHVHSESMLVESNFHEVEAGCLEDLDKAMGQLHGKNLAGIQSEGQAPTVEHLHTMPVQDPSINGLQESNVISVGDMVTEKLEELEPGVLQPHNDG